MTWPVTIVCDDSSHRGGKVRELHMLLCIDGRWSPTPHMQRNHKKRPSPLADGAAPNEDRDRWLFSCVWCKRRVQARDENLQRVLNDCVARGVYSISLKVLDEEL